MKSITKQLVSAVEAIDRPGTFACGGVCPPVLPGLEVEGLGIIGLPLSESQAAELKLHCEQAAYGKGTETVVDTSVRRVWHLKPDRFSLLNPAWTQALTGMVAQVQQELGLEDQALEPHLYDLLLYETGGFFLPHRDGEKLDRMVATLVVMLPSSFTGGELVVRHEGQKQVFDFASGQPQFQTQFAAFYADCEHEVKPLTSGYRLCLVYNLTLAKKSSGGIGAPRQEEHIAAIAGLLEKWGSSGDDRSKLALILEHLYSKDGLSWNTLKGVDLARANILVAAAARAGCQAHLALLTLWESGSAEGDYDDYYSSRSRRRYRDDDDEEPDDDETGHTMQEVYDSSLTASNWRDPDGSAPDFGELPVEDDEVFPPNVLRKTEPEEDFEGYTGNAGMTLDRWYRRAAIVVWPDAKTVEVLCTRGAEAAVGTLAYLITLAQKSPPDQRIAKMQQCHSLARTILDEWPATLDRYADWGSPARKDASQLTRSLGLLDDPQLLSKFIRDVLKKDPRLDPGKPLTRIIARHGWTVFQSDLCALFEATEGASRRRNGRILLRLCLASHRLGSKAASHPSRAVCLAAAEAMVNALPQADAKRSHSKPATLRRLIKALLVIGANDLLQRTVSHVISREERYPLHKIQIPALTDALKWAKSRSIPHAPAMKRWIDACLSQLQSLTREKPVPPTDFQREANFDCKCEDCAELKAFLLHPDIAERGFKMAQHRRSHLEDQMKSAKCDVDCTTDTRPRPQVLICRKNKASFQRRLDQYHVDVKLLNEMESLKRGR